jgi:hypothetical protein
MARSRASCSSLCEMRRGITLLEVLRQTLAAYPLGAALLAGSCVPHGGGPCGTHVVVVAGLPDGGVDCSACGVTSDALLGCYATTVNASPAIACDVQQFCGGTGRRPVALVEGPARAWASTAGACFARGARLEAASVLAFRVLGGELEAHRAPGALVEACHRAATEEIGHARMNAALTHRYGAVAERPVYSDTPPVRTLEEIAIENAREGCVRETFGALMGLWESTQARDPVVATATSFIAREELGHARLGWAIGQWASGRLTSTARAKIDEARFLAARSLMAEAPETLQQMASQFASAIED